MERLAQEGMGNLEKQVWQKFSWYARILTVYSDPVLFFSFFPVFIPAAINNVKINKNVFGILGIDIEPKVYWQSN